MIKELKKHIDKLNKNPLEAETVKALKRQLKDMQDKLCIYMTDTEKKKVVNYPCKGNSIKCSNPDTDEKVEIFMSTVLCDAKRCKYHQLKK